MNIYKSLQLRGSIVQTDYFLIPEFSELALKKSKDLPVFQLRIPERKYRDTALKGYIVLERSKIKSNYNTELTCI